MLSVIYLRFSSPFWKTFSFFPSKKFSISGNTIRVQRYKIFTKVQQFSIKNSKKFCFLFSSSFYRIFVPLTDAEGTSARKNK